MSQIPSEASRRARRADDRYPRCPVCQRADVNGLHVDRCEERDRLWKATAEHLDAAGIPEVPGRDLWAHMLSLPGGNEYQSTLLVQLVIDLGWRPVVGSDPTRLWSRPEGSGAQ